MFIQCVAKRHKPQTTRTTSSQYMQKTFRPKPVYPPIKQLEQDQLKFQMYMARKALHCLADDIFVISMSNYMLYGHIFNCAGDSDSNETFHDEEQDPTC